MKFENATAGETAAEDQKPVRTRKPRRIEMVHAKMKGVARPLEDDIDAWLQAGWARKSAGNAD